MPFQEKTQDITENNGLDSMGKSYVQAELRKKFIENNS